MMGRVQLGIIGCGVIGALHVSAAAESQDIDLIAVADATAQKAKRLADLHHVEQVYSHGRELLANPNVKAVVLAVPTSRCAFGSKGPETPPPRAVDIACTGSRYHAIDQCDLCLSFTSENH